MSAASRRRPGAVGGAPAAEALTALVAQFSERTAFVRELVQNALDAESGRIEVRVRQEGGHLLVSVADDGSGMDRDTIENALLVLFRSTKEDDLTRIGKFGIGFVSIFAVEPEAVVLDTGKDGVHHRLVLDTRRRWTLARVDEPFEGTTVTLHVPLQGDAAAALAEEIRAAVHRWCRFARAEIRTEGTGPGWGWPEERVRHPFTVDAPFQVEIRDPNLHAVLGFTGEDPPFTGWYGRGLTLLETHEAVIPGVTFRAESSLLEHTLTRDNVLRDANHVRVVDALRQAVEGPLREGFLRALAESAAAGDRARGSSLLAAVGHPASRPPRDLPCLIGVGGRVLRPADLGGGFLHRTPARVAIRPSAVADALAAAGHAVLDASPPWPAGRERHPALDLLAGPVEDVEDAWVAPADAPSTALVAALADRAPRGLPVRAARFAGCGRALEGRFARIQADPGVPEPALPGRLGTIRVDVDHPTVQAFEAALGAATGAGAGASAVVRIAARAVVVEAGLDPGDPFAEALDLLGDAP